jgi:predicted DNA-binding transcriptional regulator AlpA
MNVSSVFVSYEEAGRMLNRCAKTIRRWIESIPDFPQPVENGGSWELVRDELDAYIEKLKKNRR